MLLQKFYFLGTVIVCSYLRVLLEIWTDIFMKQETQCLGIDSKTRCGGVGGDI